MTLAGPSTVVCGPVADDGETDAYRRVRHAVFVVEQGIFADSDVDAHDARLDAVHVVARAGPAVVGTVRLYPLSSDGSDGLWQGDRLAVLPGWRAARVGAPLVRYAVAAASARGGSRMIAHVQPANREFFEKLGWSYVGAEVYVGRPHVTMTIALAGPAGEQHDVPGVPADRP